MKLLHYILPLAALLAIVSCSEDEAYFDKRKLYSTDSIYVNLTLDLSNNSITRANPNGGEEGDGWEYGYTNENTLHDFCVYVLDGNNDINSPDNTSFAGYRYFTKDEVRKADSVHQHFLNLKDYYPEQVVKDVTTYRFAIPILKSQTNEEPTGFRFIVVANCGNQQQYATTLGALRNARPTKTWTPATTSNPASWFVMTNENDQYHAMKGTSEFNPYNLHVTIERMAARIDYDPTGCTLISGTPRYEVKGVTPGNEVLAHLYVDRMAIVNGSQQPSYFFKRVADDINGTNLKYLGDETPIARGEATNYVIDPYSTQKTTPPNNELLTTLYGNSRISNAAALVGSDKPTLSLTSNTFPYTLGYVNENTFDAPQAWSYYATGVVVQCRYAPQKHFYTAYNATTDVLTEGAYELNQTFYMVEPNTPTIDESQRLYFKNEADAVAYATNTAKKHFGKVVKYENGVCYYFTYMRHSNKVEVIHNTMEFGIVRNNIYRFKLLPNTGPGTPTPDPRHPEELKARVYVKKWLSVEHPIIYV